MNDFTSWIGWLFLVAMTFYAWHTVWLAFACWKVGLVPRSYALGSVALVGFVAAILITVLTFQTAPRF